jgi:cell division protease FtsH
MEINKNTEFTRKYPISKPYYKKHENKSDEKITTPIFNRFKYPHSKRYYEDYMKRLNSKNETIQNEEILKGEEFYHQDDEEGYEEFYQNSILKLIPNNNGSNSNEKKGTFRILLNKNMFAPFMNQEEEEENPFEKEKKSENFQVIKKHPIKFSDIGGYEKVKSELLQCVDLLANYTKYSEFNVRVPKGLILEGPPGNGKTLLAKGFAGEAGVGFIAVSGSEFQEKYVGVGSSRVRELFKLAKKNAPCIIFIDEIDAIGRRRSGDGESSTSERDNTLNELLIALDGFKNNNGVFLIGATNRIDLLDPALTRPGRIDKKIFIGHPDTVTREAILKIHTKGKPYDNSIVIKDLVDLTLGLSGAQIENLLNEAMLNALREDRKIMNSHDVDHILNKMIAGWQPSEHQFTSDIIDHIAIHEMGHAIVGLLSKHHAKMTKVIINFSSPQSPGYTVFEASTSTIYTREALFEHLAILLAGRIAEETYCEVCVTNGAINDFEEAFKLAEKMIVYYGMGKHVIYPSLSDKYKEMIDTEVITLINEAYAYSQFIVQNSMELIIEGAEILKKDKIINAETLLNIINNKYKHLLELLKDGKK